MIRPMLLVPAVISAALLVGCEKPSAPTPEAAAPAGSTASPAPAAPVATPTLEAPKPAPAPGAAPSPAPAPAADSPVRHQAPGISWLNPPGYTTIQDGKPFRIGTLTKAGSPEIAVTRFGANTGPLKDNINRWRDQVGLPPAKSDAELDAHVREIKVDGRESILVDVAGPQGRQLVLLLPDDATRRRWFFKMSDADHDKIEAHKKTFMDVVQSVRIGEQAS